MKTTTKRRARRPAATATRQPAAARSARSVKSRAAKPTTALATRPPRRTVKTLTVVADESELQARLDGMGAGLYNQFVQIRKLHQELYRSTVLTAWQIGKKVAAVAERYKRVNSVKCFAECLHIEADQLLRMRRLAEWWTTREDVDKWLRLGTQWSHVQQVLSLQDDRARDTMLKTAANDGWTVRQLTAAVQQHLGKRQSEGSGKHKPLRMPVTVAGRVTHIAAMAEKLTEHLTHMLGAGLEKMAAETPRDELTSGNTAAGLQATIDILDELDTTVRREITRLRSLVETLQAAATAQAEPAGFEDAIGDALDVAEDAVDVADPDDDDDDDDDDFELDDREPAAPRRPRQATV